MRCDNDTNEAAPVLEALHQEIVTLTAHLEAAGREKQRKAGRRITTVLEIAATEIVKSLQASKNNAAR
jgi:hypothetical protein